MAQPGTTDSTTYVDENGNLVSKQPQAADSTTKSPASPASTPAGASTGSTYPTAAEQAASAGMPAAPTTPMGTASLTDNPDQSKMAGTPNQLAAGATGEHSAQSTAPGSPAQAGSEQTSQTEADRHSSLDAGQLSEAEARDQQRAQQLQQAYGEVGLGVANMISAAVKQSAGNAAGASYVVPDAATLASTISGFGSLTSDQQTSVTSALNAAAANPTADSLVAVQQAMAAAGMPDTSIPQDVAGLQALFKQQSVGDTTAQQITDKLTLTPQALQQFGITDDDLAMIGLTPQQAGQMSLADFQTAVRDRLQQSTQTADGLQQQLKDPNLDANSRAQIEQQLAAMNQAGSAATQQGIQNALDTKIAGAHDTISLGGQNYTVEQLLDDNNMSQLITQYVTSPANSDIRSHIDQQFPQLSQFIQTNQAALAAAAKQMGTATSTVAGAESANNKLNAAVATALGTPGTNPDGSPNAGAQFQSLMQQIDPNYGNPAQKYTSKAIDSSKSGVLQMLANPALFGVQSDSGTNPAVSMVQSLSTLASIDPAQAKQVMQMQPAEIQKAGLSDPTKLSTFISDLGQQAAWRSGSPPKILQSFFGTTNEQAIADNLQAQKVLGTISPEWDKALTAFQTSGGEMSFAQAAGPIIDSLISKEPKSISDILSGSKQPVAFTNPVSQATLGNNWTANSTLARALDTGDFSKVDINTLGLLAERGVGLTPAQQQTIAQRIIANSTPSAGPTEAPAIGQPGTPTLKKTLAQRMGDGITDGEYAVGGAVDKALNNSIGKW